MSGTNRIPDFSTRSRRPEIMDEADPSTTQLHAALRELETVNRYLGGYRTSVDAVRRLIPPGTSTITVLDVGTGGGDVAAALHDAMLDIGVTPDILGVDLLPDAISYARSRFGDRDGLTFETADFRDVAPQNPWDLVHASLLLHHISDEDLPAALREMANRSRLGLAINDLHRHPFAYHAIRILTSTLSENDMIRHDAPLSVLRSFTEDELRTAVRQADLPAPEIRWYGAFRWRVSVDQFTR